MGDYPTLHLDTK